MSHMVMLISEYGLYLFIGVILVAAIYIFAISNAEECPHPAQCFDCSEISCAKCFQPDRKQRSTRLLWKPTIDQPVGANWFHTSPPQ